MFPSKLSLDVSDIKTDEEKKRFLDSTSDVSIEARGEARMYRRSSAASWPLWIHLALAALNVFVFLGGWQVLESKYSHGPNTVWTPVRNSISYEKSLFPMVPGGFVPELFGPPCETVEKGWAKLLAPVNSYFTKEEVDKFGGVPGDPVILPDGTYMGALTVYHHLHCIKRLYRSFYKDHYFHNMTAEEDELLNMHNMHCLDYLRMAVQCQGDPSPVLYRFHSDHPIPVGVLDYEHECVNWDSIESWAVGRMVDPYEPGAVIHPKFGPAYAGLTPETNEVSAVSD